MANLSTYFPDVSLRNVYTPQRAVYNGSRWFQQTTGFAFSGNKITMIAEFKIPTFTGAAAAASIQRITNTGETLSNGYLVAYPSDHATAGRRNKLRFFVQNSAGTTLCDLWSIEDATANVVHRVLASFDGDTGVATFIVDGVDADDTGNAERVAPTTGTLTATTEYYVGNAASGSFFPMPSGGEMGFVGCTNAYLPDYFAYFNSDNEPLPVDLSSWLWFNEHGFMNNNKGTVASAAPSGNGWYVPDEQVVLSGFINRREQQIDFIGHTKAKYANTGNNPITVACPAGAEIGDLVVITSVTRNSYTAAPDGGGGWTEVHDLGVKNDGTVDDPPAGNEICKTWYKLLTSVPASFSLDVTDDGTDGQCLNCVVFRNATSVNTYAADGDGVSPSVNANVGDILLSYVGLAYSLSSSAGLYHPDEMVLVDKQYESTSDTGSAIAMEQIIASGATGTRTWVTPWSGTDSRIIVTLLVG